MDFPQEKTFIIGKIGSPHGIRGDLKFNSYSGETSHLSKIREAAAIRGDITRQISIERFTSNKAGFCLIKIEGADTPEKASEYVGYELVVPRSMGAKLKKGEYYIGDLTGCSLVFEGKTAAEIISVVDGAQNALFEAQKSDGTTVLVPFRKEFIGEVDIESKKIELLVDWILE